MADLNQRPTFQFVTQVGDLGIGIMYRLVQLRTQIGVLISEAPREELLIYTTRY